MTKINDIVMYTAILHPEDVGYSVKVPDIDGGFTQGDDIKEAILMTQDMIGLMLEDSTEYPTPTDFEKVETVGDDIKTLVTVNMSEYRLNNPKTIRKNVSVPEYLVKLGKDKGVNFSMILTKALKDELGV